MKKLIFLLVLCCANNVFAQCWRGGLSCGNSCEMSSCNIQSSCQSCESCSPQQTISPSVPYNGGETTPYTPEQTKPNQNEGEVVPKFDLSYNVSSVLMRKWTDKTGFYRINGVLIGIVGNEVKIKTIDGKFKKVLKRHLSEKDQEYLKQYN